MNRLAVLIALLGFAAVQAAPAAPEDAQAFCKSMCSSEQRQCRADAQRLPKDERVMPDAAGIARGDQPNPSPSLSADQRALVADGDNHRRLARGSACDTAYQQCVRACDKPKDGDKGKRKPITFG